MKNSDLWAGIVGNAAEALRHPGLTAAIRNLHPGVMPAASTPPKPAGIAGYANGGSVLPPDMTGDLSGDLGNMSGNASDTTMSMPDSSDPRMGAIADAEDALGTIESGQTLQPEHIAALKTFNNTYGPTALGHLHANVKAGMMMRRPSTPRVVVGPAGRDKVPALVNGVHQAKLTTGEFVMPTDAVAGAGHGDPVAGAQKLQHLSSVLAALKPSAAAKPLTPAGIDRRAMPVQSLQPPLPGAGLEPPAPALNVDSVGSNGANGRGYVDGGVVAPEVGIAGAQVPSTLMPPTAPAIDPTQNQAGEFQYDDIHPDMESALSDYAMGAIGSPELQRRLQPFGYRANLRNRKSWELTPLGDGKILYPNV